MKITYEHNGFLFQYYDQKTFPDHLSELNKNIQEPWAPEMSPSPPFYQNGTPSTYPEQRLHLFYPLKISQK